MKRQNCIFVFAHFIKVLSLSVLDKVLAVLEDPQLLGVEVPSHLAKGGTLLQPEEKMLIYRKKVIQISIST